MNLLKYINKILANKKFKWGALIGTVVLSTTITLTVILTKDSDTKKIQKTKINMPKLSSDWFEISGVQTNGTINLKTDTDAPAIPKQVEARYYKSNNLPTNDNNYKITPPNNLINDDNIYIKFFIKPKYINTHQFTSDFDNLIVIPISGLDTNIIDHSSLTSNLFETIGTQNIGQIRLKTGTNIPIIPREVETRYYKNDTIPMSNSNYVDILPTNLSNGDVVYIKFFIKNAYNVTHKFRNGFDNVIKFEINDLKTLIDESKLVKASYEISGSQTIGSIVLKTGQDAVVLPEQVEAKYFIGPNEPDDGNYVANAPTNLSNGDVVYIKFFIKNTYNATHKFRNDFDNVISITISTLDKNKIDSSMLNENSFSILRSGSNEKIEWKTGQDAVVLPEQVEVKYHMENVLPNSDNDYKDIPTINLNNGDIVYIKFFIKTRYKQTHKFIDNFINKISLWITPLGNINNTNKNLKKTSFEIVASNIEETLAKVKLKDDINLPNIIHPLYAIQRNGDSDVPSSYRKIAPTDLKNGDRIYVKFEINTNLYAGFTGGFTNTPFILGPVADLNKLIINSSNLPPIESRWFTIINRIVVVNTLDANIPTKTMFVYATKRKGDSTIPQPNDYSSIIPTLLKNDYKIYIKYEIKNAFKTTHILDSNYDNTPKKIIVSGIITTIDVTNLNINGFKRELYKNAWWIIFKSQIPNQVKIKVSYWNNPYENLNGNNEIDTPFVINRLSTIISVRFEIKPQFLITYEFPEDFQKTISFTIGSLIKI